MSAWKKGDVAWSARVGLDGKVDAGSAKVVAAGPQSVRVAGWLPGLGGGYIGRAGQPGEFAASRREAIEKLLTRERITRSNLVYQIEAADSRIAVVEAELAKEAA